MTTFLKRLLPMLCLAGVLTGCESYAVKGRVVQGSSSYIVLVDANDPRLDGPGVPGVALHLMLEPGKLNRESLGRTVSDNDGNLRMPVGTFGAGWLEHNAGLYARAKGFTPAEGYFILPGGSQRVLVVMAPGQDRDLGEMRDVGLDDYEMYRDH
ncbi:MAG: hypothetical protein AAFX05_01645 [Planctomycetota bacterium]